MGVDKEIEKRVKNRRKEIIESEINNPVSSIFRECGKYVQKKLGFVRGYLYIYSKIVSKHFPEMWYLDLLAGPGICKVKQSGRVLLGSPLLAATNEPFFDHYRFNELNLEIANALESRIKKYCSYIEACIFRGDCNKNVEKILSEIPEKSPFLAFIDPEGLEVKMDTLKILSQWERAELYITYPYDMAVARNIAPGTYEATHRTVTEFFGGEEWMSIRDELYKKRRIDTDSHHKARKQFLDLYISKLKELGFEKITYSEVIKSDSGHPLYFLPDFAISS